MRNILTAILFAGLLISCSSNSGSNQEEEPIAINLSELNSTADLMLVALYKKGVDYTRDTVHTDSSGQAVFTIDEIADDRVRIRISDSNIETIVKPEGHVNISFDKEEPSFTAQFSGDLASENTFLNKLNALYADYKERTDYYKVSPNVFIEAVDTEKIELNALLNDSKAELSEKYASTFEGEINGRWALLNLNYRIRHPYYVKEDSALVAEMPGYLSGININNPDYLGARSYEGFLNGHLRNMVSERDSVLDEDADISDVMSFTYNNISEIFESPRIVAFLKSGTVQKLISYTGLNEQSEKLLAQLKSEINDSEYMSQTDLVYEKWLPLAEGKPAPDFVSHDLEGKEYSLSDLKGKYVYIDVWATWCGPCRREIPYLKKLDSTYHEKNIVFMSVSIDNTEEPWKKMVEEEQLQGLQTFTQGAWSSDLCDQYNINGIPRFILIDPEGNIVNSNAERPSGKIGEILDEKLI